MKRNIMRPFEDFFAHIFVESLQNNVKKKTIISAKNHALNTDFIPFIQTMLTVFAALFCFVMV